MVQVEDSIEILFGEKKELLELPGLARALGLAAGLRAAQRFASCGRSHGASGALGLRGGRVRFVRGFTDCLIFIRRMISYGSYPAIAASLIRQAPNSLRCKCLCHQACGKCFPDFVKRRGRDLTAVGLNSYLVLVVFNLRHALRRVAVRR